MFRGDRAKSRLSDLSAHYALWLNEQGITAFVPEYRLRKDGYGHPGMMQDVRSAIRNRPNLDILFYPMIATGPDTHEGSRHYLLGLIELLSNEKQVRSDTPPTFVFHSSADTAVSLERKLDNNATAAGANGCDIH